MPKTTKRKAKRSAPTRVPRGRQGLRALHLDLKGVPPTMARLLSLMPLVRRSGYNAFLVEWEDQFPWKDESFRNETCYTEGEIAAFHAAAAKHGIEVIPLVQCLGHMETWLRPPKYAPLREVPGNVDVINPLAPGARELVEGLVEEVLARTPGCRYFHLGGDEAWTFGHHPETKAYVAKHGKGALYLRYVEPILDRLLARGIRPILWHDMMLEWNPAELAAIGKKADLCVWAYNRYDRVRIPWLRELTGDEKASRPPILSGGGGPACDALFKRFLKAGVPLWGAGAYKSGLADIMHVDLPETSGRLENAADWAVFASRFPLVGLVNTAWSRGTTDAPQYQPVDAALDLMCAGGLVWSGGAKAAGNPLRPDAAWQQKVLRKAQALLESAGEGARFRACRDLMHRLTRQRRAGWENAIKARETLACYESDPRRASALNPGKNLGYLKDHQLARLEELRGEILKAYKGLIPDLWLNRYLDERILPLRHEHEELIVRLAQLKRP